MGRECTRAMARQHAVKAEELRDVVTGVVGSGLGESVGKRADVEAWRSLEPLEEAHRHESNVPTRHSKGNQGRLSVSRISTSLPDLTALAKQWARPRCLGLWESRVSSRLVCCSTARGFVRRRMHCCVDADCSYSGHSQSQWRSCGARPLQRSSCDS